MALEVPGYSGVVKTEFESSIDSKIHFTIRDLRPSCHPSIKSDTYLTESLEESFRKTDCFQFFFVDTEFLEVESLLYL